MRYPLFLCSCLVFCLFFSGCVQPGIPQNASNATPAPQPHTCIGAGPANESVRGSVTADGVAYSDSCVDTDSARKYYCAGNALSSSLVRCSAGLACDNGVCVASGPAGTDGPGKNCIESDNAKDYYAVGSVTFNGAAYTDTCQGSYDVLEYYCENDSLRQSLFHCPTGDKCEAGACLALNRTCTDSDSANQSQTGTTTLYGGGMVIVSKTDACIDNNTAREYACEGSSIVNSSVPCPENTYCSGGSCTQMCKPFSNQAGPGIIAQGESYTDHCKDNSTLMEYSCSGNMASGEEVQCSSYCFLGRCLSDSEVSCRRTSDGVDIKTGMTTLLELNNTCLDFKTGKDYVCDGIKAAITYKDCSDNEVCQNGTCEQITKAWCYELNGVDIHVKSGVATTTYMDILDESDNYCFTSKILGQYYCDGDNQKVQYISCPGEEKCSDGVCAYNYTCQETVARSADVAGKVSLYEGSKLIRSEKDQCTGDPSIVSQVSCDSTGHISYAQARCAAGTQCDSSSGVCK